MHCLGATATAAGGSESGALSGCFPTGCAGATLTRTRQPITALLNQAKASVNPSRFYVDRKPSTPLAENEERLFAEIDTLTKRQTVLFQRSCEQLRGAFSESSKADPEEEQPKHKPPVKPARTGLPQGPLGVEAEDLYSECLRCATHMIGCDADRDNQWKLVEHLRKAFRCVLRRRRRRVQRRHDQFRRKMRSLDRAAVEKIGALKSLSREAIEFQGLRWPAAEAFAIRTYTNAPLMDTERGKKTVGNRQ